MYLLAISVIFVICCVIFADCGSIIIVEDAKVCFRRVLAGKRVARGFVKKSTRCERVEDCQADCSEEKRFSCEGFNYRLDPSGRGKGECELISVPLSHLDIGRDIYPDREYDYYEKDRNADHNCHNYDQHNSYHSTYNQYHPDRTRPHDYDSGRRPPRPDYDRPQYAKPPIYGPAPFRPERPPAPRPNYDDYDRPPLRPGYDERPPAHRPPRPVYDDRPPPPRPIYDERPLRPSYEDRPRPKPDYDRPLRPNYERPPDDGYNGIRRGDHKPPLTTHGFSNTHYNKEKYPGISYLPPNNPTNYPQYLPNRRYDTYDSYLPTNGYGTSNHYHGPNNYYLPNKQGGTQDWGQYGGSYGNGGVNVEYNGYGYGQSTFNYWGLNQKKEHWFPADVVPPKPSLGVPYLPYVPKLEPPRKWEPRPVPTDDSSLLPLEPRLPGYNFLKEECSLRTATGFKLNKGIVKKFFAVPNIYECELLCFTEKEFQCSSYAFRYTISLSAPSDNCYLSPKNYKAIDFYSDLEPDRDFDVYTMNNPSNCRQPILTAKDNSDCFWRTRSGQRLDNTVIRDSLLVKSIVDCQIECLNAKRFTCRAFSFRYGSSSTGGVIDNCQLTDWPFYELDPHLHFVLAPGFEMYERGSFGHGCEPYHFKFRGHPDKNHAIHIDQICYIGFGSPARLLPQATKKSLRVDTELDCKVACSKARESTLFQCMSFSYRTNGPPGTDNCELSDILQRDLLPHFDYAHDPSSWLFAWDNYNPDCLALASTPLHDNHLEEEPEQRILYGTFYNPIDTWRAYSVSGWPCRRGSLCQENREAGFWFCELEGGDANTWDYCCRPDHQCGFSEGFPYQWCYVGPVNTQWRKCSDRYYPYVHNLLDRIDNHHKPYLPPQRPPPHHHQIPWIPHVPPTGSHNLLNEVRPPPAPYRPGWRPDRPEPLPSAPTERPPQPSLEEYEMQFDAQFLDPPKPGGFGQPRHWPISYLHKEMPPNITDSESRLMKAGRMENMPNNTEKNTSSNTKLNAIQDLIKIIKSNDLDNVQYQITNASNTKDDVLFVKIQLPSNFTQINQSQDGYHKSSVKREQKSVSDDSFRVSTTPVAVSEVNSGNSALFEADSRVNVGNSVPVYRRGYITRTNVTTHGSRSVRFTN